MPLIAFYTTSRVGGSIQIASPSELVKEERMLGIRCHNQVAQPSPGTKYDLHSERTSLSLEGDDPSHFFTLVFCVLPWSEIELMIFQMVL